MESPSSYPEDAHQKHLKKRYEEFVSTLSTTPPPGYDLEVGDTFTFTNDYGVSFEGKEVIGFEPNPTGEPGEHLIYFGDHTGAYWYPCHIGQVSDVQHSSPRM